MVLFDPPESCDSNEQLYELVIFIFDEIYQYQVQATTATIILIKTLRKHRIHHHPTPTNRSIPISNFQIFTYS